jgi:hypothetical protein
MANQTPILGNRGTPGQESTVNSSTTSQPQSAPPSQPQDPLALFRELSKVVLPMDPNDPEDRPEQEDNQA